MCELSNSEVNGFQSWYFPDKPYFCRKLFTQADRLLLIDIFCFGLNFSL